VDLLVDNIVPMTADQQARLLSEAVARRSNAIVLSPIDYLSVVGVVHAAHDQGVPVIVIGSEAGDNPGFAWSFVFPEQYSSDFRIGAVAIDMAAAAAFSEPPPNASESSEFLSQISKDAQRSSHGSCQ
jgi:ABC-type sugar transport system substrate-binding protein